MSNYSNRILLLETLATNHPALRHGAIESDNARKSFFKSTDELTASNVHGAPANASVVFNAFSSRLVNKNDSWRFRNFNQWLFLDKVKNNPASPNNTAALIEVTDRMEAVVIDFVNYLLDDYEDNGGCGLFKDLDVSSFHWEEHGPVADNMYGWKLSFQDETRRIPTPDNYWLNQ